MSRLKWPLRLVFTLFNQYCSLSQPIVVTLPSSRLCHLPQWHHLVYFYMKTVDRKEMLWKCMSLLSPRNRTALPMQGILIKSTRTVMTAITQNYGLHHWSKLENWQGETQRVQDVWIWGSCRTVRQTFLTRSSQL